MRGSLSPRARRRESSCWTSDATRAGRLLVAISTPPVAPRPRLVRLGVGERAPAAIAEVIAVGDDLEVAPGDLDLAAVHGRDEVGHLVEGLVHEGVLVPDGGDAEHAPL